MERPVPPLGDPRPPSHAVVIGGTGMLAEVTLELAARGAVVTVIGRRQRRVDSLARRAGDSAPRIHGVALDYTDGEALPRALTASAAQHGPVSLVVAWIHGTAPQAPLLAAQALSGGAPLRYVHVLGSAAADPSAPDGTRRRAFESIPGVVYEEVVLGFVPGKLRSRWLRNEEISAGVLGAIDTPASRTIVGTVRPWSARP